MGDHENQVNELFMRVYQLLLVLVGVVCGFPCCVTAADDRPNMLWIVVDDMSANFSCDGETSIETPHVDRLAEQGLRFTRAYATAPVCSPFRSAMITGMYQTSIGAHHHRSGRGEHRVVLPDGLRPIPTLFPDAGCYTWIQSGLRINTWDV